MNGMKRAQAAMEYLMTYGWALLVIVLVLGALIYLGVLNPQGRMQDMCNLPIGFGCEVAGLSEDGTLYIKITNQQATPLEGMKLRCLSSDSEDEGESSSENLSPGQSHEFECELPDFSERNIGDFINGDILVEYSTPGSSVTKTVKGSYSAKVSVEATE